MSDDTVLNLVVGILSETAGVLFERYSQPQAGVKQSTRDRDSNRLATLPSVASFVNHVQFLIRRSERLHAHGHGETLSVFLQSRNLRVIVRHITLSFVVAKSNDASNDARDEFIALYIMEVDREPNAMARGARLFAELQALVASALQDTIKSIKLHPATGSAGSLLEELETASRLSAILRESTSGVVTSARSGSQAYLQQVATRHSMLRPACVGAVKQVGIDKLYVVPLMSKLSGADLRPTGNVDPERYVSANSHLVILGNPGGGKSTWCQWYSYRLAIDDRKRTLLDDIPIVLTLREYAVERRRPGMSLVKFLRHHIYREHLVKFADATIEFMLLSGKATVCFDGLDELIDISQRDQVRLDIQAFAVRYPYCRIVVTSREVGYRESPMDTALFKHLRIEGFDVARVATYVSNWFESVGDSVGKARLSAQAFLKESEVVSDLRVNPLMLSLMCNLYRGDNYIPQNRPELYQKCSDLLFSKWDDFRKISNDVPFSSSVRPVIASLAYWIMEDQSLQSGVTSDRLIRKTIEYLYPQRCGSHEEAEESAEQFIAHCTGRAWVFTDTGSTGDERAASLFQFTHRTFLEYYTALHLVRTTHSASELAELVSSKVLQGQWEVICQLALQVKSVYSEKDVDAVLTRMMHRARHCTGSNAVQEQVNACLFMCRSLGLMAVSAKAMRYCIKSLLSMWYVWSDTRRRSYAPAPDGVQACLRELARCSRENRGNVLRTLCGEIERRVSGPHADRAVFALELIVYSPRIIGGAAEKERGPSELASLRTFLAAIRETQTRTCVPIQEWSKKNQAVAVLSYSAGIASLQQLCAWHGTSIVLKRVQCNAFAIVREAIGRSALQVMWNSRKSASSRALAAQTLVSVAERMVVADQTRIEGATEGLLTVADGGARVSHVVGDGVPTLGDVTEELRACGVDANEPGNANAVWAWALLCCVFVEIEGLTQYPKPGITLSKSLIHETSGRLARLRSYVHAREFPPTEAFTCDMGSGPENDMESIIARWSRRECALVGESSKAGPLPMFG